MITNLITYYESSGIWVYPSVSRYGSAKGLWLSAFRSAMPLIKRGAAFLGKKLLSTGAKVATDVVNGNNLHSALKQHAETAGKDTLLSAAETVKKMVGFGRKKRKKAPKKVISRRNKRKKTFSFSSPRDIFS